MPRRNFSDDTRIKCLLWSDRHCCLCGKECRTNIVLHHIEREDDDNIDNAIPVCFDCHGAIHGYDDEAPLGSKYQPKELKSRREQVYERYTQELIPPVKFDFKHELRPFPDIDFNIYHLSNSNPIHAKIEVRVYLSNDDFGLIDSGYYNGQIIWNLNPLDIIGGGFRLPIDGNQIQDIREGRKIIRLEVKVTVIDRYEREHRLLPHCFTFRPEERQGEIQYPDRWSLEPTTFRELDL